MDTVKTLVAFCHLQRAAYSVQCTTCNVNTGKLWSCVTKHTVKGKHCWFIVPLRRLPCHVNYIISLPVWLLAAPAATPTRHAAPRPPLGNFHALWGYKTFVVRLQLQVPVCILLTRLRSTWLVTRHVCVICIRCCLFSTQVSIIPTVRSLNIDTNLMLNIPTAAA